MKPFQPAILGGASEHRRGNDSRGMRMSSPEKRATASSPIAAKGSVNARNVSGAMSVTPILRSGQLQPHTNVSTPIGASARARDGPLESDLMVAWGPMVAPQGRRKARLRFPQGAAQRRQPHAWG